MVYEMSSARFCICTASYAGRKPEADDMFSPADASTLLATNQDTSKTIVHSKVFYVVRAMNIFFSKIGVTPSLLKRTN